LVVGKARLQILAGQPAVKAAERERLARFTALQRAPAVEARYRDMVINAIGRIMKRRGITVILRE
jgi:hypothetical protein